MVSCSLKILCGYVEYGPVFGPSLAVAYGGVLPDLEQEIKTIYEGNVERGWMTPKLQIYENPDAVNAPLTAS